MGLWSVCRGQNCPWQDAKQGSATCSLVSRVFDAPTVTAVDNWCVTQLFCICRIWTNGSFFGHSSIKTGIWLKDRVCVCACVCMYVLDSVSAWSWEIVLLGWVNGGTLSWGGESRNCSGNTSQRAASGLQSRCISVGTKWSYIRGTTKWVEGLVTRGLLQRVECRGFSRASP